MRLVIPFLLFSASAAFADVRAAVETAILPAYAGFAAASQALSDQAATTCDAAALQPAFNAAWDAWMGVQHLHLGPAEEDGRALAIAYWPDPKGMGTKAQKALLAAAPETLTPEKLAEASVAARGLTGLERLLYPAKPLTADPCPLIRATAADLARMAAEIDDGWTGSFADAVLTAGQAGNSVYLKEDEAKQALFTQLITGLEHLADTRLGRPLGSFDTPAPEKAEARASARSLRNVALEIDALAALADALADDTPATTAAFARAKTLAVGLADDPVFAGVATPQGRLKVEILQQSVQAARDAATDEIGTALGVGLGFNALDGD